MSKPSLNRVENAIAKLRNTLSFEYFKNIPQYRNITIEQYNLLVKNYERICQIMLEAYLESLKD